MATIGLRLFGRPAVDIDGVAARITERPLHVLVRLAVAMPEGVGTERLLADVWGPAGGSEGALRVAVNRVRSVVGHRHVRFEQGTYRLVDVDVDLHRFEQSALRARSLSAADRVPALEHALDLVVAPAFDGMRAASWIGPYAHRFDELHEDTVDAWLEALLGAGSSDDRLPELVAALDRTPTRERRCARVALALYRAGRQAEALRAIADTRRTLRDELGVHPGPDLRDLERRMLDHDPTLLDRRRSDEELAVEAHLRAAQALLRAEAYADASAILDAAEAACAPTGRHAGLVALARARLAVASGQSSPLPHIERAQRIGRERRDGLLLARAALALVGSGVPDDRAAVLVALTEPLDLLPPDATERVDLLCAAAVFVMFIDASDVMHRLLAEAERLSGDGDERARVVVMVARSLVDSLDPTRFEQSAAAAESALLTARRTGDPDLVVAAIQAALRDRYSRADLAAVEAVVDELERASLDGTLAFGRVRARLCRASLALVRSDLEGAERHAAQARALGTRLGTFAIEGAARTIDTLIALERGRWDEIREVALAIEAQRGPTAWAGLAAWAGDEASAERLAEIGPGLPRDDSFDVFAALAAEVAARRRDAALGRWCLEQLAPHSGRTVLVGVGTAVLGLADHFTGLALTATGDLDAAAAHLERAVATARASGASLWAAHSTVELAFVVGSAGDVARAHRLLDEFEHAAPSERVVRRLAEVRRALGDADDALVG